MYDSKADICVGNVAFIMNSVSKELTFLLLIKWLGVGGSAGY